MFVVLAAVCHADVTWFDAGELTAAQVVLGVPHPTGFPLLVLLGHAASLLPLGPLPLRVSLVSAACVALATALIHATALLNGPQPAGPRRTWAAAAGALLFPAAFVVWLHGTVVEVYSVNAMMIAWLAWLLLRPAPRWTQAAFVTGLGLGAHATFALVAAIFWAAALTARGGWRRVHRWVPWGLVGALVIAYLPLAAGRDPWLNWGDPSSLEGLVRHLTAAGIRESFADEMGVAGASTLEALTTWSHLALGPLPVVGLFALAAGGALLTEGRWVWVAALLALLADAWFSAVLNPMGQADLQTGMPGALAASLGLALVVSAAASEVSRPRWLRGLVVSLAVAAVALAASEQASERGGDDIAGPYGRAALLEPSPGSLVLVSSDHLAAQFLYHQGVEGIRPDLTVIVKQHAHDNATLLSRYRRSGLQPPASVLALPRTQQAARVEGLVKGELSRRGVYWEPGDGRFDPIVAGVLRPVRVLYRVATSREDSERPTGSLASPTAELVAKLPGARRPGPRSRRVLSDLAGFRGVWHLLRSENAPGGACLEEAAALDPDNPRALLNLAAARRRQGRLDDGIALLQRATALVPRYRKAWENLAVYHAEAGDESAANEARHRLESL